MEKFFKGEPSFRDVYVKGEVSGTYESPMGHFYFTLKDKRSKVPCIVYIWFRKDIGFEIENGMKLLIQANVSVYWPHGKYQLDVRSATDEGLGKLTIALQQLKRKLRNEGLFDDNHKKALPEYPKKIGVITSKGGSVIHDIVKTVKSNWPYCQVLLFPAAVQGANSKRELVEQIRNADSYDLDVLIVARGGGSMEELWSYNEESVVRTIFECRTPIITAIGHEDNTTLSDLVADKRASTPTMAASLAIKNKEDVLNNISHLNSRLMTFISTRMDKNRKEFENILSRAIIADSSNVYGSKRDEFNGLCARFGVISNELITLHRHNLSNIKSSYSIRHPCKMQLDSSKSSLSDLHDRLINAMDKLLKDNRVNLDKSANKFNFLSDKLVTSKRYYLEKAKNSHCITNPCQKQLDSYRNALNANRQKMLREMNIKISNGKMNMEFIKDKAIFKSPNRVYLDKSRQFGLTYGKFIHKSSEIILKNRHDLETIEKSPVIRNQLKEYMVGSNNGLDDLNQRLENGFNGVINESRRNLSSTLSSNLFKSPEIIYKKKSDEFRKIKTSKIIENPYMMLDSHKRELNFYREKLDKISQVIELKKEQKKQKATYRIIIVAIVILMIIILFIIFGGI